MPWPTGSTISPTLVGVLVFKPYKNRNGYTKYPDVKGLQEKILFMNDPGILGIWEELRKERRGHD